MRKINNNDNLRIKKSHSTHFFVPVIVLLSIAAVGQVKVFWLFLVLREWQKNTLPRMTVLPQLTLHST